MIDTNIVLSPSAEAKLDLIQAILADLAMQLCEEHDLDTARIKVLISGK